MEQNVFKAPLRRTASFTEITRIDEVDQEDDEDD